MGLLSYGFRYSLGLGPWVDYQFLGKGITMKATIENVYEFRDMFRKIRPDNFSHEGLGVLWDYLEAWEIDTGQELDCDVIAFCCDFSEDTWREIAAMYDIEIEPADDDEANQQIVNEWLTDNGAFVGQVGDSFVFRNI